MPYTVTKNAWSGSPAFTANRTYEGTRDALRSIENRVDGSLVSGYTYQVNPILFIFLLLGTIVVAREPSPAEHVASYDVVVIGKYYNNKSGGGYVVYDILKGSVDKHLLRNIRETPNLGARGDGSAVLFMFKWNPLLKGEKHMINKKDEVFLRGKDAKSRCSIGEIRDVLLNTSENEGTNQQRRADL
jgi:hypothetical protein